MTTPYIGTHIAQITDTYDDDAIAKIQSAYVLHTSRNGIYAHTSIIPAANSVLVGAKASELVNNSERPDRLILSVNFAPPDRKDGTENNARNDFFCADLGNNISVCGTSNGFEFSYIKKDIKALYRLTNTNSLGSQFRSLQILPKHAVLFSAPETRERLITDGILARIENIDDIVPSILDVTHVLQVDNFDNVKLVPSHKDKTLLQRLTETRQPIHFSFGRNALEVGGNLGLGTKISRLYSAVASRTLFAAPLGTNVVAATSSSKLSGNRDVPIIATIRANPAETRPKYKGDLPQVGYPVFLVETRPFLFDARRLLGAEPVFAG